MTRRFASSRMSFAVVGALIAVPLLGGCGFDQATNRVNTISAGINDREGEVDVLGAVVIAGQDNLGVFAATLVNNDLEAEAALVSVGLDAPVEVEPGEDSTIPAGGLLNLFETGGVEVSGEFGAGDFVDVTLNFDTGQVTRMTVNVVTPCRQYAPEVLPGIDVSPAPLDPSIDPVTPEEAATEDLTDATGREDLPPPYTCKPAEPVEHGEELDEAGDGADPEPGETAE